MSECAPHPLPSTSTTGLVEDRSRMRPLSPEERGGGTRGRAPEEVEAGGRDELLES